MKNYIIYFIILFGISGCTTERKAVKFLNNHPLVAADYCATKYPVKEKVVTEIKYVPANNKDYTGQINQAVNERDSALIELEKLKKLASEDKSGNCKHYQEQIPKLEATIRKLSTTIQKLNDQYEKCKSDTVKVDTKSIQENTAKLDALQLRYNELDKQHAITKDNLSQAEKWRVWFFVLVGLIGIYVFMKLRRILP